MFRMNSPEGKAILATVRDGDYAHPGEERAIRAAADLIQRDGIRRILDVGCGRGGTAEWFRVEGWGAVVGVDIDADSITYAKSHYPGVDFLQADVQRLDQLALSPFDLVYLFTAYYAFPEQRCALERITSVCAPGAQFLLVDYTLPDAQAPLPELGTEIGRPVVLDELVADLEAVGWREIHIIDWTPRFVGWYQQFLERLDRKRHEIIHGWGIGWYTYADSWYRQLLIALEQRRLGGAVVTAVR